MTTTDVKRAARLPGGKVRIQHTETGEELERYTVDARGMVESGEFEYMGARTTDAPETAERTPSGAFKVRNKETGDVRKLFREDARRAVESEDFEYVSRAQ